MTIDGAVVTEQGVKFAIVVVQNHILNSQQQSNEAQNSFRTIFPGMPVILMGQDTHGTPQYYGREDIVQFLANIDISRIPWMKYTVN
jgi:hypothetical protein